MNQASRIVQVRVAPNEPPRITSEPAVMRTLLTGAMVDAAVEMRDAINLVPDDDMETLQRLVHVKQLWHAEIRRLDQK